jgi:hypothetical protein
MIVSASHILILYSVQAAVLIGVSIFLLIDLSIYDRIVPTLLNLLATLSDAWQWFDASCWVDASLVAEWNKTDF